MLVASLALLLVLPATLLAFARLSPTRAVLVVFLGSTLFLPEDFGFDAPMLPLMDKHSIPMLCLFIGAVITARARIRRALSGRVVFLIIAATLAAAVGTTFTNSDSLAAGKFVLPGLKPGDIVSLGASAVLGTLMPFFLARALFRTSEDARDLLKGLVIAGLLYAPFCLVELRLSPQFHNWIYGYNNAAFDQTMRGGGWRPMVFMTHGLALALFIWAAGFAGWVLAKARQRVLGQPAVASAGLLTLLLLALNSMGALVYGLVATPVAWFLRARGQMRVATFLAIIIMGYPMMRATDTFPHEFLTKMSASVSSERAESLNFRFENENILVRKSLERPWFGWGGYGRWFMFDKKGEPITVPDGDWIIVLAGSGVVGLVIHFGLLLGPVLIARKSIRRLEASDQMLLGGTSLLATIYCLDLLPNGMFNNLPTFLAGAVAGLAEGMRETGRKVDPTLVVRLYMAWRALGAARNRGPTREVGLPTGRF